MMATIGPRRDARYPASAQQDRGRRRRPGSSLNRDNERASCRQIESGECGDQRTRLPASRSTARQPLGLSTGSIDCWGDYNDDDSIGLGPNLHSVRPDEPSAERTDNRSHASRSPRHDRRATGIWVGRGVLPCLSRPHHRWRLQRQPVGDHDHRGRPRRRGDPRASRKRRLRWRDGGEGSTKDVPRTGADPHRGARGATAARRLSSNGPMAR
jgi:hypothetical protein